MNEDLDNIYVEIEEIEISEKSQEKSQEKAKEYTYRDWVVKTPWVIHREPVINKCIKEDTNIAYEQQYQRYMQGLWDAPKSDKPFFRGGRTPY